MRIQLLSALIIAGTCASCSAEHAADPPNLVWYSHAGCYGSCPRFEIFVDRKGQGTFEGRDYTTFRGKRRFSVTPQQFDSFVKALDHARQLAKPLDKGKNVVDEINSKFSCPPNASYHTDDTGVFIMWSEARGDVFYSADYGCDADKNQQLYDAIDDAPRLLGLDKLIGQPER